MLANLRFRNEGHNFVELPSAEKIIKTCRESTKQQQQPQQPNSPGSDNSPRIKIMPNGCIVVINSDTASDGLDTDLHVVCQMYYKYGLG